MWDSDGENPIVPAGSGTSETVPSARPSFPNGVIVYGPRVAGGAAVPGEPSNAIEPCVHVVPVQLKLVLTVLPELVFWDVVPFVFCVSVTVQLPELWQSAW